MDASMALIKSWLRDFCQNRVVSKETLLGVTLSGSRNETPLTVWVRRAKAANSSVGAPTSLCFTFGVSDSTSYCYGIFSRKGVSIQTAISDSNRKAVLVAQRPGDELSQGQIHDFLEWVEGFLGADTDEARRIILESVPASNMRRSSLRPLLDTVRSIGRSIYGLTKCAYSLLIDVLRDSHHNAHHSTSRDSWTGVFRVVSRVAAFSYVCFLLSTAFLPRLVDITPEILGLYFLFSFIVSLIPYVFWKKAWVVSDDSQQNSLHESLVRTLHQTDRFERVVLGSRTKHVSFSVDAMTLARAPRAGLVIEAAAFSSNLTSLPPLCDAIVPPQWLVVRARREHPMSLSSKKELSPVEIGHELCWWLSTSTSDQGDVTTIVHRLLEGDEQVNLGPYR